MVIIGLFVFITFVESRDRNVWSSFCGIYIGCLYATYSGGLQQLGSSEWCVAETNRQRGNDRLLHNTSEMESTMWRQPLDWNHRRLHRRYPHVVSRPADWGTATVVCLYVRPSIRMCDTREYLRTLMRQGYRVTVKLKYEMEVLDSEDFTRFATGNPSGINLRFFGRLP